jgi:hypothetical protein
MLFHGKATAIENKTAIIVMDSMAVLHAPLILTTRLPLHVAAANGREGYRSLAASILGENTSSLYLCELNGNLDVSLLKSCLHFKRRCMCRSLFLLAGYLRCRDSAV